MSAINIHVTHRIELGPQTMAFIASLIDAAGVSDDAARASKIADLNQKLKDSTAALEASVASQAPPPASS